MELVPLSITLNTSPVFLALCHLTPRRCRWLNKLNRISFVVNCCTLEKAIEIIETKFHDQNSPDPENVFDACDETTLPPHPALKQRDQGIEKDCVVREIRLLCRQAIDDCLVEPRNKDVDSSQGENKDDAGKNSNLKSKLALGPEVGEEDAHLGVQSAPCGLLLLGIFFSWLFLLIEWRVKFIALSQIPGNKFEQSRKKLDDT